jgi:hypothetical protein
LTTVPPSISPWDLHSQYPSTGMAVGQVSLSVWQVFARAWPPPSATMVNSVAAANLVSDVMLANLSRTDQGVIGGRQVQRLI